MSALHYCVVLRKAVEKEDLEQIVESFVSQLGVKEKTALQILNHIPLKVFSKLTFSEARILVEALNVVTRCQWEVMLESEVRFASANWNKKPTIMGLGLNELLKKNDPKVTGVSRYMASESMDLLRSPEGGRVGKSVEENDDTGLLDSRILESADTIVKSLSSDFNRALDPDRAQEVMRTQVLKAMEGKVKEEPLSTDKPLEKGIYDMYLPEINEDEKAKVLEIAMESLGMESVEVMSVLSKPTSCIVRNVDEKEALRLVKLFDAEGIALKNRIRSKA